MKINIVEMDDWEGLYIDNRLWVQGHKLNAHSVLAVVLRELDVDVSLKNHWVEGEDEERLLTKNWHMPDTLPDWIEDVE